MRARDVISSASRSGDHRADGVNVCEYTRINAFVCSHLSRGRHLRETEHRLSENLKRSVITRGIEQMLS